MLRQIFNTLRICFMHLCFHISIRYMISPSIFSNLFNMVPIDKFQMCFLICFSCVSTNCVTQTVSISHIHRKFPTSVSPKSPHRFPNFIGFHQFLFPTIDVPYSRFQFVVSNQCFQFSFSNSKFSLGYLMFTIGFQQCSTQVPTRFPIKVRIGFPVRFPQCSTKVPLKLTLVFP